MSERVKYGSETVERLPDGTALYIPRDSDTCHDCGVERGETHLKGCDVEQCPECRRQLIGCDHGSKHL